MKCPFCNKGDLKVLETRECPDNITRRRKACNSCERRFTTYEHIEVQSLKVVKSDGSKDEFKREKILSGIEKACEKRDITREQMETLADQVVQKVYSLNQKEVTAKKIGLYVLNRLKKIDKVAYVRFASVYRDFEDIEHFESELNKLQK